MNLQIGQVLAGDYPVDAVAKERSTPLPFLHSFRLRFKSDEELMEHLRGGEADALTLLFERHSPLVYRTAWRILKDSSEAEDTVQQVFFDIYRALAHFDPQKGTFKTWLLMFAYHRTFNKRRQLRANGSYQSEELDDAHLELIVHTQRPDRFSHADARILVDEALAQLRPRQRTAIELTYYEGLTAEEIAAQTGLSVRVVRHNVYRGLDKLRVILGVREK